MSSRRGGSVDPRAGLSSAPALLDWASGLRVPLRLASAPSGALMKPQILSINRRSDVFRVQGGGDLGKRLPFLAPPVPVEPRDKSTSSPLRWATTTVSPIKRMARRFLVAPPSPAYGLNGAHLSKEGIGDVIEFDYLANGAGSYISGGLRISASVSSHCATRSAAKALRWVPKFAPPARAEVMSVIKV